jgi:hypothetical protein
MPQKGQVRWEGDGKKPKKESWKKLILPTG